jgi:hypothetical protein
MPHQPYSSYLAFSDFYLFPTVKEKLERSQLADEDQFFECVRGVLSGPDQQELNPVFQAWVRRVQEVSEDNRDDIRWQTIYIYENSAHSHQTGRAHILKFQTISIAGTTTGGDKIARLLLIGHARKVLTRASFLFFYVCATEWKTFDNESIWMSIRISNKME